MAAKKSNAPRSGRDELNDAYARYVVSPALLRSFGKGRAARRQVIIDLNFNYLPGDGQAFIGQTLHAAQATVETWVTEIGGTLTQHRSRHHVFASLTLQQVKQLLTRDREHHSKAIYKVSIDRELQMFLDRSVKVVKADACGRVFSSDTDGLGSGVVWAVIDSGIDETHPHFSTWRTLELHDRAWNGLWPDQLQGVDHQDFTNEDNALVDACGHGTHVAGIIAGATPRKPLEDGNPPVMAVRMVRQRNEEDSVRLYEQDVFHPFSGVAPQCKLISLKVLRADGSGAESSLLAALDYVARVNEDGRRNRINGVNISIGYDFDPEWFAAGQSPLCVAVNRLVDYGVVVVVAAGNRGSTKIALSDDQSVARIGLDQSIADPGNAEKAITVGSTHAESPETYGVSYFSSRGPTADGRMKPDLVAPGERIVSCASSSTINAMIDDDALDRPFVPKTGLAYYREESGTSMAAPHVSGAAAALMSVHREFLRNPNPQRVKKVLLDSATSLGRQRDFQGAGLVDVLRAVQSI